MKTRGLRASTVGLVGLAFAGSAAIGVLAVALPTGATLALCVVGLVILGIVSLRRALLSISPPQQSGRTTELSPSVGDRHAADLRLQRLIFYLGVVTVAQSSFRLPIGLTVSEVFFLLAFLGCVFAVLRGHTVVRVPPLVLLGAGTFAVGGALSSYGASAPTNSGYAVLHALYVMVVWAWTGAMVLPARRHQLLALTLWVISAAVDGIAAASQVAGVHALVGATEGSRATGFTQHPNDLGGAAAIALAPALFLATVARAGRIGLVGVSYWFAVALIAAGLVLSGSVAGMAAAGVAVVVWLASPSVRGHARGAVVAALAAAAIVALLAGGRAVSPVQRLQLVTGVSNSQPGAGSGQARLSVFDRTWPRILDDPFIGVGLDTSAVTVTIITNGTSLPNQVHSAPLAAWYEAGVFGLIGFVLVTGVLIAIGWRTVVWAESDIDRLLGWALFAAFNAFLVYAMTAPLVFQQYGWLCAVMLMACYSGRRTGMTTWPARFSGPTFVKPQPLS